MFLKSLKIENRDGLIRDIQFHAGLNLIVDETPSDSRKVTGNNVGKTTVLKLIDVCLGANPKKTYTDLEDHKSEYTAVKNFLIESKALITLTLCESFQSTSDRDLVIERNFLPRKELIRRINGVSHTEVQFEKHLTDHLFPGHYGKKPTFRQVISHNIRYKEPAVSNTLRTLDPNTRDDEYEALYLFLLGCQFDQGDRKQQLSASLRTETTFKRRLEGTQTKSAYQISLEITLEEMRELEERRASVKKISGLDDKIRKLGEIKYKKGAIASDLARLRLRQSLVKESIIDVGARQSNIDVNELKILYSEVSQSLGKLTKTFGDLVTFHNKMVTEKIRYISKDIPILEASIAEREEELRLLILAERSHVDEIAESGSVEDIEEIVVALNERYRRKGEYEKVIAQITAVDDSISGIRAELKELEKSLFSEATAARLQSQLTKFNRHFSAVSEELYGEKYALKEDRIKNIRTDQNIYRFSCFNTNFSSGKKQGEITCFDIAYTLFADEDQIPCYHFLLNDKKELMHDNQLERIGRLIERKADQIQFVASILRDKLPPELNKEEYMVVQLSQADKLFRVETNGRPPEDDYGEDG